MQQRPPGVLDGPMDGASFLAYVEQILGNSRLAHRA